MLTEASPREIVTAEALRILRGLGFNEACEKDVLLFGSASPAASPLPLKIGVDKCECVIYNIRKQPYCPDSPVFRRLRYDGGYIDFELDEAGFEELFYRCERQHPFSGVPAERLTLGVNAGYMHARLLHHAAVASPVFDLPASPAARRALWQCMMAASAAQRTAALNSTAAALDEHRVNNTLCARVLNTMAALVLDWFNYK